MDIIRIPFEAYKGTEPFIFVSYSHKDSDKVFPIISEFHKAGFPIWYDEGIDPGNEWPTEIANALLNCSLFIVFISSFSKESKNVVREINYALSKDKPFIHIWLEETTLNPGLDMQISTNQGIMLFRMEPENFYRKCRQTFEAFKIKKTNARAEPEEHAVAPPQRPIPDSIEQNNDAKAYAKRGQAHLDKKQDDAAISDFTEAIRLDPNNAFAYANRGRAHLHKEQYDAAMSDFTEAIRLDPNDASAAYNNRGIIYMEKHQYDAAISDFTEAIRVDPNNAFVYCNRGQAHLDKKQYDAAISDLTEAIRLDPNYASAYANRGCAYRMKGQYDAAISDLTEFIRLDPNNASAYAMRGAAYRLKDQYDAAISDLTEAIRLDPNIAFAYAKRGDVYMAKGQKDAAISDYNEAIRLDPNNALAYEWREISAKNAKKKKKKNS